MTICLDAFGNPYYKVTPSKSNDNAYWKAFGSAGSTDLNFVDTQNDIAIAKKVRKIRTQQLRQSFQ